MSAPTFFRFDGWVQTPTGEAVPGASVAVLDQPANFTSQPGSPLATIYGAPNSNSATITGASWAAQQITFTLSATPPVDVVPGSYISVTGANPAGFNGIWLVVSVLGSTVTVVAISSPGTYVSGGTVATSVLPNPVSTDGNGHYFFYALPGIYSVQVYGESIFEQDYPDQDVGVIAGGSGSVTSVGLIGDGIIFASSVTGSPITSTGSFDLSSSLLTQAANKILAGPTSGSDAAPTFRTLVAADIPSLTFVSSVGLTLTVPSSIFTDSVSGSPVTGSGTLAATIGLANQSANEVWAGPSSGSAAAPSFRALVLDDLPFTGTPSSTTFARGDGTWAAGTGGGVTSVAFTGDGVVFNSAVSGSPITGMGTLAPSLHTQTANTFFAGPSSAGPSVPTFRAIGTADLPFQWSNAEIPSGSGTAFTLAHTPAGFLLGFRNVSPMIPGTDFTISGASITLARTIGADTLTFWYTY